MDSWTRSLLMDSGYDGRAIRRLLERGELVKLRRDAYLGGVPDSVGERHRTLLGHIYPRLGSNAVISHASAALIHGLPTWDHWLHRAWVTRTAGSHGRRLDDVHHRMAQLTQTDVQLIDGMRVTSPARTVLDVARLCPFTQGVALIDAARHGGASFEDLVEVADRQRRWPGIVRARAALDFSDSASESVMESISRVLMHECGLPTPILQFDVYHRGCWVARTDFAWPELGVVGEYDGAGKYGELLGGRTAAQAILAEKRREGLIRDAGWWIIRWDKELLSDQNAFARFLRQGLGRGNPALIDN